MPIWTRSLVTFAAFVVVCILSAGCGSTEVPLSTAPPKVDVPPPPPSLTKAAAPDRKDVRPAGGSGSIDISTYGRK
ncbi:MAG: hypothetical protein P4L84_14335 [Isosphaeraceae bacterium]|nr:hypothetical protein [Isosphaeraceae bacterium]